MAVTGQVRKRATAQGPNLQPLKEYLEAQKLHQAGRNDESLKVLSRAMGSQEPLTRLEGSLGKVFDDGPLSDLTLHLALTETKKRRN